MTCFVTVGTTKFDQLIRTLDDGKTCEKLVEILKSKGINKLSLQIGKGEYVPSNLIKFSERKDHKNEDKSSTSFRVEYFDYEQSILARIQTASLVISHAGAGSILDTLRLRKKLLVVVNECLMENHQLELATALQLEDYLKYCHCHNLLDVLQTFDMESVTPIYPDANKFAFSMLLDHEFLANTNTKSNQSNDRNKKSKQLKGHHLQSPSSHPSFFLSQYLLSHNGIIWFCRALVLCCCWGVGCLIK